MNRLFGYCCLDILEPNEVIVKKMVEIKHAIKIPKTAIEDYNQWYADAGYPKHIHFRVPVVFIKNESDSGSVSDCENTKVLYYHYCKECQGANKAITLSVALMQQRIPCSMCYGYRSLDAGFGNNNPNDQGDNNGKKDP